MAVEVVHFNPMRRPRGLLGRLRPRRPLNNFGDLIGPMLVNRVVEQNGLVQPAEHRRLLAVGSIMRMSEPGDVIWGSGVNGKTMGTGGAPDLDVRAVRGPRTRALLQALGTDVPEVYGDPALLWPRFWPKEHYLKDELPTTSRPVTIIPNYNDMAKFDDDRVISPLGSPHEVIREIVRSEFVCATSLHGIVLAEAYGIPARLIRSEAEPPFKYDDYYAGTGRPEYRSAATVEEAVSMGGEAPLDFDAERLLQAFPSDVYDAR